MTVKNKSTEIHTVEGKIHGIQKAVETRREGRLMRRIVIYADDKRKSFVRFFDRDSYDPFVSDITFKDKVEIDYEIDEYIWNGNKKAKSNRIVAIKKLTGPEQKTVVGTRSNTASAKDYGRALGLIKDGWKLVDEGLKLLDE